MSEKLIQALTQLETRKRKSREMRAAARKRAAEQLDTMPDAIHTIEAHVRAGKAGLLGQRRLRTALHERERLMRVAEDG